MHVRYNTPRAVQDSLKGRYRIERELGRGGFGVVYLARDEALLARRVVVKVLVEPAASAGDEQQLAWVRRKFKQEIEALARIDHPGVVGVLDTGRTPEGRPFLVMPYVEGITLRSALRGPLPLPRTANIIRLTAHALSAAHERGVCHRDLKPDNVMLQSFTDGERVRLIDFGIAAVEDSRFADGKTTLVAGSLTYMAPEQFAAKAYPASDTFALGVIAYEMLTGRPPFDAQDIAGMIEAQKDGPRVLLRALRPELPAGVEDALLRALACDPDKRHRETRDFGDELARALEPRAAALVPQMTAAFAVCATVVVDGQVGLNRRSEMVAAAEAALATAPALGNAVRFAVGDSVLAAFSGGPTAALEAALGLLRLPGIRVAAGIHHGAMIRSDDPRESLRMPGSALDVARRAAACARPGEALLTEDAAGILSEISLWAPRILTPELRAGFDLPLHPLSVVRAGEEYVNPADGLIYVWVPPGSFEMGCEPGDPDGTPEEMPRHRVQITRGFYVSRAPVPAKTFGMFARATQGYNPPDVFSGAAVSVNWDDAVRYCSWAGGRLPTEAEWEYAVRTSSGLDGTLGVAWQWCQDWFDPHYYAASPEADPAGPAQGVEKAVRGGSWDDEPCWSRPSARRGYPPATRSDLIGFRCVIDTAG